jgi:indole-3-acetate monooxygenase
MRIGKMVRDIHAAGQHLRLATPNYAMAGQAFLGADMRGTALLSRDSRGEAKIQSNANATSSTGRLPYSLRRLLI